MEVKKQVMSETLEGLVDEDLKSFCWQLWNGLVSDLGPVPRAKLQRADRRDVVDCMVDKYCDDAGAVAVRALEKIGQNNLAKTLESRLREVSSPAEEQIDPPDSEVQPILPDWRRTRVTTSSEKFKRKILEEKRARVYIPMDKTQRRRVALLITNIHFQHLDDRDGADRDEENMEWLLSSLDFRVEKHRDLTGEQINSVVLNFSKRPEHRDSDGTFVVLMSHGARIQNKDAILGVNYDEYLNPDDFFFVDDTFIHLNSKNCSALIDKPKVILVQACRGEKNYHPGGVDVQTDTYVHLEKDFISFKSTLPDTAAYRDPIRGSYFIIYLVKVFSEDAHDHHILELFTEVTLKMAEVKRFTNIKKLMPSIDRSSLPKELYLFPGL